MTQSSYPSMKNYRASLASQEEYRCVSCAEQYENHTDERAYNNQQPVSIFVNYSEDAIYFMNYPHQYIQIFMETKCEKCGGKNVYPLNYWEESKIIERNEKRGFQSSPTTAKRGVNE